MWEERKSKRRGETKKEWKKRARTKLRLWSVNYCQLTLWLGNRPIAAPHNPWTTRVSVTDELCMWWVILSIVWNRLQSLDRFVYRKIVWAVRVHNLRRFFLFFPPGKEIKFKEWWTDQKWWKNMILFGLLIWNWMQMKVIILLLNWRFL